MELGKKIACLRKMKKITQLQLAEYLSVTPQTVSRWEAEGGAPDIMLLPKIATFFEVSLDELFGMTDMEQIENLVYKYSVLRDEKSFEEVMRSIDMALNSLEEKENKREDNVAEENQRRQQLLAWRVHIYIQKSRGALEQAEAELDELRKTVTPENPLYLPLKLQKQQFRIQMGEAVKMISRAKAEWDKTRNLDNLCVYIMSLFEVQRCDEILNLWVKTEVQNLVQDIDENTEGLWMIMFESARMECDLEFFTKHFQVFNKKASEQAVFEAEWELAKLYKMLNMEKEKMQMKTILEEKLQIIEFNPYIKNRYTEKINEL